MCTVSWLRTADGYHVFCNRDERMSRPAAESPQVRVMRGVRCVSPLDPTGGGTWIAANQFGVTVCLLNLYVDARRGTLSRGRIVRDVMHSASGPEAMTAAADKRLGLFSPFTMLALDTENPACILCWTGREAVLVPNASGWQLLTSSSVDQTMAAKHRCGALPRVRTLDSLRRFHHSHEPRPGPSSVCMHRTDAQTVSFSHIEVNDRRVSYEYVAGPPCLSEFSETTTLARNHADSARSFYASC
jgi:hypothetical protein